MPAASSSSTSCQRLACREPEALVWASSSTRINVGRRARAPSRSRSRIIDPRYSTVRLGRTSRPWRRASVSTRPWVSTKPTTTSTPSSRCSRAASSMAYVLPTPAAAPKNTFSLPRRRRASSSWTRTRSASGSGRASTARSVAPAVREASTPPYYLRAYQHAILDTGAPANRTRHRQRARPLGLAVDEALELQNTVMGSSVDSPPRQPGLLRDALIHLPHELVVGHGPWLTGVRCPPDFVDQGNTSHDPDQKACLDDREHTDIVFVHQGGRDRDRRVGLDRD